ncbi:DUF5991 domain-containing protein [Roseomonas sp. BN140053]|uniref:DUF5991 domain-containing protein n=1 Tax=Roseomonas sp. BN140053 TaxID=3391898 RepID=UPI0039E92EB0
MAGWKAWIALAAMAVAGAEGAAAQGPSRNPAQTNWAGQYRYEWSGGRTVGGTGIVVTYDLRVGPGGATDCALDITGFQSDEHILCEIGADAGNLWIRFRSYADGSLLNSYGRAQYRPGQSLFQLRRGRGSALQTEWQSMSPEEGRTRPATRFRKV